MKMGIERGGNPGQGGSNHQLFFSCERIGLPAGDGEGKIQEKRDT